MSIHHNGIGAVWAWRAAMVIAIFVTGFAFVELARAQPPPWVQHGANQNQWLWGNYSATAATGWSNTNWNAAKVLYLHDLMKTRMAGSTLVAGTPGSARHPAPTSAAADTPDASGAAAIGGSADRKNGTSVGTSAATAHQFACPFIPAGHGRHPGESVTGVGSEREPNTSLGRATPLSTGGTLTGTIGEVGDVDWYRIGVPHQGRLTVTITPPAGIAPVVRLRNRNGSVIYNWSDSAGHGQPHRKSFDLGESGTYFIEIADAGADNFSAGRYTLKTSFTATADRLEPNGEIRFATSIAATGVASAAILPVGDVDFYCLIVDHQGELNVALPQMPAAINAVVRLRDGNGSVLVNWNKAVANGEAAKTRFDLAYAGVYYLEVADSRSDASSPHAYRLETTFTPTADPAEPNPDIAHATPIALATPINASILPQGDIDFYRLQISSQGELRVFLSQLPSEIDAVVRLRDANGSVRVNWIEAQPAGQNNIGVFELPEPGTYYLEVADSRSDARSVQSYTLTAHLAETPDVSEPNADIRRAQIIQIDQVVNGSILPLSESDFYRLDIERQGALTVEINPMPNDINAVVRLRNGNGSVIQNWAPAASNGKPLQVRYELPSGGTYYLQIADSGSDASSPARYGLATSFQPTADTGEPNNVFGLAHPIRSNADIKANILPVGDVDFYAFNAAAAGVVSVAFPTMPATLNLTARLRNADGSVIHNWAKAGDPGMPLTVRFKIDEPGMYYLEVADASSDASSATPYIMRVSM